MPQDNYAETAVTLFGLGLLALGSLAMFVRFLLRRREQLHRAGRQLVADVRKGEGFTFHRQLTVQSEGGREANRLPKTLALRQWLDLVNHRPDNIPHIFVEGGSGTGKTTFTKVLLNDRGGPVAIVGVKPDDEWGTGYVFHSSMREAYLSALLQDVNRRLDENDRSGLTIVLDDFTRLAATHTVAIELYKLIADVGRSLRIRLVLVARGRLVKGLGSSGESDLREHFVFITLRRDHTATLEYNEEEYQLDTSAVLKLAQPIPAARWWKPTASEEQRNAQVQSRRNKDYLLTLLEDGSGESRQHGSDELAKPGSENLPASETHFSAEESDFTSSEPNFSAEEIAKIAALIASGKGKTEVVKAMPRYSGRKHSLYSAYYDRLAAAMNDVLSPEIDL